MTSGPTATPSGKWGESTSVRADAAPRPSRPRSEAGCPASPAAADQAVCEALQILRG